MKEQEVGLWGLIILSLIRYALPVVLGWLKPPKQDPTKLDSHIHIHTGPAPSLTGVTVEQSVIERLNLIRHQYREVPSFYESLFTEVTKYNSKLKYSPATPFLMAFFAFVGLFIGMMWLGITSASGQLHWNAYVIPTVVTIIFFLMWLHISYETVMEIASQSRQVRCKEEIDRELDKFEREKQERRRKESNANH